MNKKNIIILIAFLLLIGLSSCGEKRNELAKGKSEYLGIKEIEVKNKNEDNEEFQGNQNGNSINNQEGQGPETSNPDIYIPAQYGSFFYDLFRFEVVNIEYGFKDKKNRDTSILYVILKENYNTYIQRGKETEFDESFAYYQQIYQSEIEESGEIETYSRICVSSKVVDLFEVGKEYIAQGGSWTKVKGADGEEIGCINLTYLQHSSTDLDLVLVDCLAEVSDGKVYPKEFSYGAYGFDMSLYETFLDLNCRLLPEEQKFTSGDSCKEFINWLKSAYTYFNERSRPPVCYNK
ncbi:MAG: hypothetical protein NC182_06600 [Prevotella sp.]|nr:hypothetical protein [Staphylococcus sp.]MCM1350855.1 hypothetical protein [Prevotella sp.]